MLKSYKVGWWVGGGLWDFSVSPRPLGFGFLGFGAKGLGPGLDNLDICICVFLLYQTGRWILNTPRHVQTNLSVYPRISLWCERLYLCLILEISGNGIRLKIWKSWYYDICCVRAGWPVVASQLIVTNLLPPVVSLLSTCQPLLTTSSLTGPQRWLLHFWIFHSDHLIRQPLV